MERTSIPAVATILTPTQEQRNINRRRRALAKLIHGGDPRFDEAFAYAEQIAHHAFEARRRKGEAEWLAALGPFNLMSFIWELEYITYSQLYDELERDYDAIDLKRFRAAQSEARCAAERTKKYLAHGIDPEAPDAAEQLKAFFKARAKANAAAKPKPSLSTANGPVSLLPIIRTKGAAAQLALL